MVAFMQKFQNKKIHRNQEKRERKRGREAERGRDGRRNEEGRKDSRESTLGAMQLLSMTTETMWIEIMLTFMAMQESLAFVKHGVGSPDSPV